MARFATAPTLLALLAAPAVAQPKITEIPPRGAAPAVPEAVQRLREEVELIAAQLDTKKALVKAAEVAVATAEDEYKVTVRNSATSGDVAVGKAKSALEAAKAQLDVRKAEANEVAVKLRHAKRRADDAAAPATGFRPIAVVPGVAVGREVPRPPAADRRRLILDVEQAEAGLKLKQAEVEKAKAALQVAKAEVERLTEAVKRGIVSQQEFDAARAKLTEAEANIRIAEAEVTVAEVVLKRAKLTLDEAAK